MDGYFSLLKILACVKLNINSPLPAYNLCVHIALSHGEETYSIRVHFTVINIPHHLFPEFKCSIRDVLKKVDRALSSSSHQLVVVRVSTDKVKKTRVP